MPDVLLVVVLLAAACVPLWLLREPRTLPGAAAGDGRAVSVVVPARDEEHTLPALLASLPTGSVREVVVVDDDSADRTTEGATAAGG